jgi:hypothetical protein
MIAWIFEGKTERPEEFCTVVLIVTYVSPFLDVMSFSRHNSCAGKFRDSGATLAALERPPFLGNYNFS